MNCSRRGFLKLSMALGVASTASGLLALRKSSLFAKAEAGVSNETMIPTSCMHNCGGRCLLYGHVQDGVVTRFTSDTETDSPDFPQVRACQRGRSQRRRLYHPNRLKYPMKRVGKRGEGKFERITWEEALTTIASQLTRIKETYGNASIYVNYGTGVYGQVSGAWLSQGSGGALPRFLNLFGGYLNYHYTYSSACYSAGAPYTYGKVEGNSSVDLQNSKLIILFADNMVETRMGGANLAYYMKLAKDKGAKIIVIDPRYSDTAIALADEWIPIRPDTDSALMAALAYVLLQDKTYDQGFLDTYCLGFDEEHMPPGIPAGNSYKSYLLGLGDDQLAKTPEWAEGITGVPKGTIIQLARQMAAIKPCALIQGLGWQRHAYGEQPVRALPILAAMTGNVGVSGGGPGLRVGGYGLYMGTMPAGNNGVKASIPCFTWSEAVERGHEMTKTDGIRGVDRLPSDIKMIWNYAGNALINQHSDINGTAKILADEKKCEFILVHDVFMTSSAKFADILLPDMTHFEREDIDLLSSGIGYAVYHNKVIEPMYECRDVYQVCSELAEKLGFKEAYTEGKTEEDWLRQCVEGARAKNPKFPSFDEFKKKGIYKEKAPKNIIAYEKQISDPLHNTFETPSGKIEIFSPRLWEMNNHQEIPAIPRYIPTWEGYEESLTSVYPLQCIGHHTKRRTHSIFDNVDWMEEIEPHGVWINPMDAAARNVKDGDQVRVFNERGEVRIHAKVTPLIMPGVLSIPQGAWYTPDEKGIDQRGCMNTLTKYHPTPLAKGNPQHTNLVEVNKV